MTSKSRFGRRIAIPSTRQIRHELLAMELKDLVAAQKARDEAALPATPRPPV